MADSDEDNAPVSRSTITAEVEKVPTHDAQKLRDALNMVFDNICMAQAKNAVFTMADCRNIRQSRDVLREAISTYEKGMASFAEVEVRAINSLIQGANIQQQQKPAVFSFDGAIEMLENLELLQEWVKVNRSPSQKLRDARESKSHSRKQH